ncbi:sugar 3,4-ketoisomerase [Francisella philomiragia]|uniref:dTDP-6-deoxy-3,4-keto-hexulose isomerase n=1 Tax=Francisella philomiragia TaxID=28110 RepID=A0A0B6CXD7_9GAMM|nr:FdtA/QdtA family cupin domain-containing protein [Francisella philomiragia]AJI53500.1 dTDP-6-deoxy-3,4-keto-hexulose isomerase [Francisella philomiragia]
MTKILKFNILGDDRGSLISLEQNKNIPFDIKRVYYIFDTNSSVRRGFHAHKNLSQVLICVSGSCKIMLDDGKSRKHFSLDNPHKGLIISGLVWREMYEFSNDCVLMVLASELYDETDYIRNYDEFIKEVNNA